MYQHVDDLTQVMWARSESELAGRAYVPAKSWAQTVRLRQQMTCSEKNVIIPPGMPARAAQRALLEQGVRVDIEKHGVDVGTDVIRGQSRDAQKLKDRSSAAEKRAR